MKKKLLALAVVMSMLLPVMAFADDDIDDKSADATKITAADYIDDIDDINDIDDKDDINDIDDIDDDDDGPNGAKKVISLKVNGKFVEMDQPPIIVNGRTLVPLRAVAEALGCQVEWDNATRSASFKQGDVTAVITVGESYILIGDGVYNESMPIDSPAIIVGSRTMIPLRALSEGFGYSVDWDSSSMTVTVSSKEMSSGDTDKAQEQGSIASDDDMSGAIQAYAGILDGTVKIIDAVGYDNDTYKELKARLADIAQKVETMTYDELISAFSKLKEIDESLGDMAGDAGVGDIVENYYKELGNSLDDIISK